MSCKPSIALRCKRLWPNRAADDPTVAIAKRLGIARSSVYRAQIGGPWRSGVAGSGEAIGSDDRW